LNHAFPTFFPLSPSRPGRRVKIYIVEQPGEEPLSVSSLRPPLTIPPDKANDLEFIYGPSIKVRRGVFPRQPPF
jgi:hypothetical protein